MIPTGPGLWYKKLKAKGFFKYVGKNILLILLVYAFIIFLVFIIGKYLVDFNGFFNAFIERLSDHFVILLFFASESFTGMIPVDLFVIWAQKFEHPMPYLALLGILSYAGGVISYGIGLWISSRPKIKLFTERRLKNYIGFVRKWGGAFIIIAALLPFSPFSMIIIAVSLLKYPFKFYLLFGITRITRFIIQGFFYLGILNVDNFFAYLY